MPVFMRAIMQPPTPGKPDLHERIRLECPAADSPDVVVIADERVTSRNAEHAQILETSDAVWLTPDGVRWLHDALGELLAGWDADPTPDAGQRKEGE